MSATSEQYLKIVAIIEEKRKQDKNYDRTEEFDELCEHMDMLWYRMSREEIKEVETLLAQKSPSHIEITRDDLGLNNSTQKQLQLFPQTPLQAPVRLPKQPS